MNGTEPTERRVTSRDGTPIAFEQSGSGPAVVLVASALSDRSDTRKLAALLAAEFTVANYDRRGRGASGDTAPYAVQREVEDIDALIEAVGGSASLFGSSSGAILGLEAADRLGSRVERLAMYEPPLILDDSRPPIDDAFVARIEELLAANRRSDAVRLFMSKGLGIPGLGVALMRFMPGWRAMVEMAHTLPYDLAITRDVQAGRPLPAGRWESVESPVLVMTGGKSEAYFHAGARSLAAILRHAEHRVLDGQHHGSVVMGPKVIAGELRRFYAAGIGVGAAAAGSVA
jgi:pimeloyl-ACP methyl ester carboxylesterase